MKRFRKLVALAFLLSGALILSVPTYGSDGSDVDPETLDKYLAMVKQDLTARRNATLRTLLTLTEPEAQEFWPLQEAYDKELAKLHQTHKKLLHEYSQVYTNLTPENAAKLADGFFGLEEDKIALHRKYMKLMSDKVSPVVAVQFLQLQNQFETMGDVKTSSFTPLAAEGRVDSGAQAKALDAYLEAIKDDLTEGRDAALSVVLKVDDAQAKELKKFKKAYDKESGKISKESEKLLLEYRDVHTKLTAAKAEDLAERFFALDEQRTALHRKYVKTMSDEMSPVIAIQFMQVQYRFETMANLKASTYVPLATR